MIRTNHSSRSPLSATHSSHSNQGRVSILAWLKKRLRWIKKRKKKDLEIYPLF
jgi:hypothetical protein